METKETKVESLKHVYGDREHFMELVNMYEEGNLFDFSEITYEQLKTVWWNEQVNDSAIAEIFEIDKRQVYYKRNKMEIKEKVLQAELDKKYELETTVLLVNVFAENLKKRIKKYPDEDVEKIIDKMQDEFKNSMEKYY